MYKSLLFIDGDDGVGARRSVDCDGARENGGGYDATNGVARNGGVATNGVARNGGVATGVGGGDVVKDGVWVENELDSHVSTVDDFPTLQVLLCRNALLFSLPSCDR